MFLKYHGAPEWINMLTLNKPSIIVHLDLLHLISMIQTEDG